MGAVGAEVVQPPKVGLQLPTGQLGLQQQGQMARVEWKWTTAERTT